MTLKSYSTETGIKYNNLKKVHVFQIQSFYYDVSVSNNSTNIIYKAIHYFKFLRVDLFEGEISLHDFLTNH